MKNSDNSFIAKDTKESNTSIEVCMLEVTNTQRGVYGYTDKMVTAIIALQCGDTIEIAPLNVRGNEIAVVRYSEYGVNQRFVLNSMLDMVKTLRRLVRGHEFEIVLNTMEYIESPIDLKELIAPSIQYMH